MYQSKWLQLLVSDRPKMPSPFSIINIQRSNWVWLFQSFESITFALIWYILSTQTFNLEGGREGKSARQRERARERDSRLDINVCSASGRLAGSPEDNWGWGGKERTQQNRTRLKDYDWTKQEEKDALYVATSHRVLACSSFRSESLSQRGLTHPAQVGANRKFW